MAVQKFTFATVPGHSVGRRAIGFLEREGNAALDAKTTFEALEESKDRDVRKKFDLWLSGGRNDRWFHGWPNDPDVKECWSFRWDEKRQHHRLYGYLYHPQPQTKRYFQICVLAYHDFKNDESTDRTILLRCMKLRSDALVQMAISLVFPDKTPTKGQVQ